MTDIIAPPPVDFNSITANSAAQRTYDANKEAIVEAIRDIDKEIEKRSAEGRRTYVARVNLTRIQQNILSEYYAKLGYETEKVYTNTLYVKWA